MKFYMKGDRLAALIEKFSKSGAEGKSSPFLEAKEQVFESYIGFYTTFTVINVYEGKILLGAFEARSNDAGKI